MKKKNPILVLGLILSLLAWPLAQTVQAFSPTETQMITHDTDHVKQKKDDQDKKKNKKKKKDKKKEKNKKKPRWGADHPHDPTKSSHLWIARNAIAIMARNQDGTIKPNEQAFLEVPEYREQFEQGLYDADYLSEYNDGGMQSGGWKSHFYDPDTGKNYKGETDPTAKTQGTRYFKKAGDLFASGDYGNAFYYLGIATHYFTDVTQPMHAANFTAVDVRALRLHSKFEEFAQSIQDQYKVTDAGGNYDGTLSTPESRIHAAAVAAKKEFPNIVNDKVIEYYNKAAVSDYYANLWRQEVTPGIGRSLKQAQRDTAGFLHLWFQTYVGDKPVPHTEIKDVNGNVVTSGRGYLIVPAAYPKRGLTYEWYSLNRYDYVMLSNTSSDNRVNGTPIEIVFDLENNGELHQGQSVLLSMKQSSYADYTYLNWSNTSSWVHLAKRASDTARFKLKANPNRPNEYFIYTDGYPLNYQHNGDAKSWAVLGKRTDQPDAWMIVPAP